MTQEEAKRPSENHDKRPADAETEESLALEVFAGFRRLADKIGVDAVREALRQSILVTPNADQCSTYDTLREDIDAYLGGDRESDVEVRRPEGFRQSRK